MILISCGGGKSALENRDLKTESLKAIIKNYDKSTPDFNTMRGRLKCFYDDGDNQQNINISYRYENGSALWMSAKFAGLFQVAKLMITPENIQFYERIDNSYFDGNFELASSFLGLQLSYDELQNMLLGQAIKPLEILQTDFETIGENFQLVTNYDKGLTQKLLLDSKTFKIKQQILSIGDKQIKIVYNSYQTIDNSSFPEEMMISAGDQNNKVNILLAYKNIKLNEDLNFPFRIPSNFSPLELK